MTRETSENPETIRLLSYGRKMGVARVRGDESTIMQTVIAVKEWQAEQRLYKALAGAGLVALKGEGLLSNPGGVEKALMARARRVMRRGWEPGQKIDPFGPVS